ncbi:MAG: ANTAR domain-containing protein [Lachnospiraceae bacterium]|nr:ANTAR domain-containing protein [Lachnospiraceae bacterium]
MGGIVVAMPKQKDAGRIAEWIKRSDIWEEIITCDNGSEVLRTIESREISLVIASRKLKDMGYEELYHYLPHDVNMLLLTKIADCELYSSNVIILQIPFKVGDLLNSVRMLLPTGYRRTKKKPAVRSDGDKLTIDKAKLLLMDRNNMTEPEAYRYLQKSSMDMGRTMAETAHMLLTLNAD